MTQNDFGVFNLHLLPLSFSELIYSLWTRSDTYASCITHEALAPNPDRVL